jgi:hypothetical protein
VKKRTKILILIAAFTLVCLASGLLFLRTERFQKFARMTIVSEIQNATGLDCRIENVSLDVYRGGILISGFELVPRTSTTGLVTLRIRSIRAVVSISSFWHFRIRLAELDLVSPQVELISSGGDSAWNPEEFLKNLKISLRLEAGRVSVKEGLLKVNNRATPFNLSLENLDCEIRYAKNIPSYRIHLEYKGSRIHIEQRDIVHDLGLMADLSLRGATIEHFRLNHGKSLLTGSGSISNWESPVVSVHTTGILDAKDLRLAESSLFEGKGDISVSADLRLNSDGIYSKGIFSARDGGYRKMAFRDFSGSYEIRNDVLYLRGVSGRIAKGIITAEGEIQLRAANKALNRVTIEAKNVPLIDTAGLLNLPLMNYENTADSKTVLIWGGGRGLKADCDAVLHGLARPAQRSGRSTLLEGNVRFIYYENGGVRISSALLRSPHTSVEVNGGQGEPFHIQLSTSHVAEPLGVIAGFSPPVADLIKRQPDLLDISGVFDFSGDVRIKSSDDVSYDGSLSVRNGRWRSYAVDSLNAQAHFRSPRLKLQSISVRSGAETLRGNLELAIAEGKRLSEFGFQGDIQNLPLTSMKDFGLDTTGIAGNLSGRGSARLERDLWEGEGQFFVENGSIKGEPFDELRAQATLRNQRLQLSRVGISRGAARMSADGQVDLETRQLNLRVRLQGLSLNDIPAVRLKKLPVQGRLSASGVLKGSIEKPAIEGSFDLDELRYESWNLGRGKGTLEFENETFRGSAKIQSDFGALAIQASVSTSAGYPGKAMLEFENLDVRKISAGKVPEYLQDISTALKGKLEAEGNFEDFAALRIRGEVDGTHVKIHDYELRNDGQIRFAIADGNLRMESVRITGDGTSLYLGGTIPLDDSARLSVNLNGSLNLGLLEGIEKKVHTSGVAVLSIQASGTRGSPQIIGRATLQDARLEYADLPFRFSAIQGDMVFSRNLVRFENIRGNTASGALQVSGILEHQNAVVRTINMEINVQNARLPYPKDFRSVVNARLLLNGNSDFQILSGDVNVIRAEYLRSFNLLEQLTSRSITAAGPLTTDQYLLGLRLNVEIHSENGLIVDNELTKLRGSFRLTLRGTPAYPSLTGRVESSEGTIFFRGNRFEISHATADFIDRNRINPILEIRAEADVKTYRLILDAAGDLEHLNLNVTSDPPMSTVDILSLLTTGKAETGTVTSQRESAMTSMSAASVLSENLTGVIGKRVQRIFGLESFRVDPFLAGAENDPTARITISERISKDLVVTYSQNLSTNEEQIIVIEYDINKDLSLVGTRDEDGKFGLDFRFRKRLR